MDGRPVWLASVSKRSPNGFIVKTAKWGEGTRRVALKVARRVIGDGGMVTMERAFLMQSTLCLHRGATDAEIEALPEGPGGLAGPPFDEVIYESPACPPVGLSFQACALGKTVRVPQGTRRDRYGLPVAATARIPIDCGECASCRARLAILADA